MTTSALPGNLHGGCRSKNFSFVMGYPIFFLVYSNFLTAVFGRGLMCWKFVMVGL